MEFGNIFNLGFTLGYLLKDPHLRQNSNDEETYYCAFNVATRTNDGRHTILAAFMEGDMAYTFATNYRKYDTMLFVYENVHIYKPDKIASTNRIKVIGYSAFSDMKGSPPVLDPDEAEFIEACRKLWRESAPLPSKEEVYTWKSVKKDWALERRKHIIEKKKNDKKD